MSITAADDSTADPTARALQLLSLLQTHRFWPGGDLAQRLGVTTRTLRRDIDRIRTLGYRVEATSGTHGGYRLGQSSQIPPMLLDDDDAVAIAIGLRMAASATIDGIDEAAVSAMAKLEQVLPERVRRRVAALHQSIETIQWQHPDVALIDGDELVVIAQACRDREELRFDYRDKDGDRTARLVEPHQLVAAGRRWYLVAWDLRRADWRTFRVDRLSGSSLAGGRFEPRPLPAESAGAYVTASMSAGRRVIKASVIVHDDDQNDDQNDEHVGEQELGSALHWIDHDIARGAGHTRRITLRAESIDRLLGTVGQLATIAPITVEGPAELVERVAFVGRAFLVASGSSS